ncbi:hypothetical protein ADUPG1_009777, partial [Aduncisulcus paluster]
MAAGSISPIHEIPLRFNSSTSIRSLFTKLRETNEHSDKLFPKSKTKICDLFSSSIHSIRIFMETIIKGKSETEISTAISELLSEFNNDWIQEFLHYFYGENLYLLINSIFTIIPRSPHLYQIIQRFTDEFVLKNFDDITFQYLSFVNIANICIKQLRAFSPITEQGPSHLLLYLASFLSCISKCVEKEPRIVSKRKSLQICKYWRDLCSLRSCRWIDAWKVLPLMRSAILCVLTEAEWIDMMKWVYQWYCHISSYVPEPHEEVIELSSELLLIREQYQAILAWLDIICC